jgi:hypothetical protein
MDNNSNNSNNSNNIKLGPSISQGQVFRKQQESRILNKNKIKNDKTNRTSAKSAATIESFSLNADINNYNQYSNDDIVSDDAKIKSTNDKQKAQTQQSITTYSNVSNVLNNFQQGVTDEAKAYNNINKNTDLLNKNYITGDQKTIRVNNKGVINTINKSSLQQDLPITAGINISTSIADPPPGVNYIPVEKGRTNFAKGSDTGLYHEKTSTIPIKMHTEYKLEGENVFVAYPYPNSPTDINKNMVYYGAYTTESVTGLTLDRAMPQTTLNCLQRAVDKGFSWCGMTEYNSGGGKCMIGTPNSALSPAYNIIPISQSGSNTILKHPTGYTTLTFGADGVLYSGHDNYKFAHPLTNIFSSELDPTYGGSINSFTGSYGLNQGLWNWQNLANFSGNSDPTGQPSATFDTLYQYDVQVPNIGYYTYYNYDWMGRQYSYRASYTYYTTEKRTQLLTPNTAGGNITYINYKCGKVPTEKPINISGQNAGMVYSISCMDLYSKYPSFTLELSDTGILTITNNASAAEASADSKKVINGMSFKYKSATLSNGRVEQLNMPRPDWVSGGINKDGGALTASSKKIHSITNGQWISSPKGYCRLILTNGTLLLEYSLQDVSQDKDGNLVGNGSSVALYSIQNANASNLGMSAHIDINGAVNPYPKNMIAYDNKYTEMNKYIPNPSILNKPGGKVTKKSDDQKCRIECNNDPMCAGYVLYEESCNRLTADQIFPTGGDRIPDPANTTYIRNPMFPNNDKSCRKTLDVVTDSNAYSYYVNNGITAKSGTTMTPNTKCNLGKVLDSQMKELEIRNNAAVEKGDLIKGQFQDLFKRENRVLHSISKNREDSKKHDENTKKATDKIQSIKNAQITKSAVEKDSDLLLISDNYRYVTWGIVSLLLSIAAIKGLRAASD